MGKDPSVRFPHSMSFLAAAVCVLLYGLACGGQGGNGANPGADPNNGTPAAGKVLISGTFAPSSSFPRAGASSLDSSSVKQVLVFNCGGEYTSAAVTDGAFSIAVGKDTPLGMIFVGATNNFLGYLALGNGLSLLPMGSVGDDVETIDLETLSASGAIVTPGHDPIGTELPMTATEQAAFLQSSSFFASVVRNPDVDGNGVIDFLEGKFYRPFVAYGTSGNSFNGAHTPSITDAVTILHYNLTLCSEDTSDAGAATVTGPEGSGLTNAACQVSNNGRQVNLSAFSDLGSSSTAVPVAGNYVFTTSLGKTLTVGVPDQSDAPSRIAIALPTITLNSDQTIHQIDWVYRTADNSADLSPASLVHDLIVEIDHPAGTRVFNSSHLANTVTSLVLADQTIPWDSTLSMCMAYNDFFGNHYVVSFKNY